MEEAPEIVVETSALEGSLELALEELRRKLDSPVSYDVSSQVMGGMQLANWYGRKRDDLQFFRK